jgi:hypothetical protein
MQHLLDVFDLPTQGKEQRQGQSMFRTFAVFAQAIDMPTPHAPVTPRQISAVLGFPYGAEILIMPPKK